MAEIIWILVPLAAIVGSFIIRYQKNKMIMMNKSQKNEEEVEDVRKLVNSLKTRIENLEAIAAGEPDEFKTGSGAGISEIEIEQNSVEKENRQKVSDIANKRRNNL